MESKQLTFLPGSERNPILEGSDVLEVRVLLEPLMPVDTRVPFQLRASTHAFVDRTNYPVVPSESMKVSALMRVSWSSVTKLTQVGPLRLRVEAFHPLRRLAVFATNR